MTTGRSHLPAALNLQQDLRVVLISYEFTFSPFSGNGILARSLVKALLGHGCHVTVWCCRPHPKHATHDHHLEPPEISKEDSDRLNVHVVTLSSEKGWRRLDSESAWREFHWTCLNKEDMCQLADAFKSAHVVCAIDWTGGCAWRSVPHIRSNGISRPPLVYLNFRVYSSGVSDTRLHEWYDDMECQILQCAHSIVVLSEKDKRSLLELMNKRREKYTSRNHIEILHPPLRADMQDLAMHPHKDLDKYLPRNVAAVSAKSNFQRCFLTCVVRLSPEKDAMRFVSFVQSAAPVLAECGLTPLLAGAAADASYAKLVKSRLVAAAPNAVIVESFLPHTGLAAVFSHTAVNFHPCSYDAYGMTIVEAAAFGVPSIAAAGGVIGATAIVGGDGAFEVNMPKREAGGTCNLSDSSIQELLTIIRDRYRMEGTGRVAQERALAWDEMEYGKHLLKILRRTMPNYPN